MSNKKKLLTSGVALVTAAALTLGGTFAWQSISQKATNEASDIVNPGGRLHNDQHWVSDLENDTNIYVENFIEEGKGDDIYARVRLSEYMEVVMNYGTKAEVVDVVAGSKTLKDGVTTDDDGNTLTDDSATRQDKFDYEYAVHDFNKDKNATDDFFTWQHADENTAEADLPYFMPTFNKNKDSVAADLNGEYVNTLGGISNRDENQYTYEEITADTDAKTANAIYDADSDKDDELKTLSNAQLKEVYEQGENVVNTTVQAALTNKNIQLVSETHEVTQVGKTKGLISMSAWLDLAKTEGYKNADGSLTDEGKENLYGYWVYDVDGSGWVYWSAPIAAGETTGLLLDGFKLNGVMDDTWYYAIDVEAQFVTANDVGKDDNTGFYHIVEAASLIDEDGSETTTTTPKAVSEEAEELLKLIGVEISDATTGDEGEDDDKEVKNGIYLSLTQAPCEVTETTDEDGNTVLCCLLEEEISEDTKNTFQFNTEYWDDGTDKTNDYTYTYTIKSGKYGPDHNGSGDHDPNVFTVSEADGEGKVKLTGDGEYYDCTFDTNTNTLVMAQDTLYSFELTMEVTVSDGEDTIATKTFKLGCAIGVHIYAMHVEGNGPDSTYSVDKDSTSQTITPGETVEVYFWSADQSLGNFWQIEVGELTGDCTAVSLDYSSGAFTFEHKEEGCAGVGTASTVKMWLTNYPWDCAEYTVICGTSSAGGGTDWR